MTPYPTSEVATSMRAGKAQLNEFRNNVRLCNCRAYYLTVPCEIGDLIFYSPLGGSYLLKYLGSTLTQVWYYSGGKWLRRWRLIVQVIRLFSSSASQMCVKSSPALWMRFRRYESSCWTSAPAHWLNWSQQSSTIQIGISRPVNLSKQQAMCASSLAICKQHSADVVLQFVVKVVITGILNALSL